MRVNELIEAKRKELGLSKADMAKVLGMEQSNYQAVSDGRNTGKPVMIRAYHILGIPAQEIMKGELEAMIEAGTIKVDKGIPMPSRQAGVSTSRMVKQLEVGDSILFDKKNEQGRYVALDHNFGNKYRRAARRLGYTIAFRLVEDGVRMWRTS